MRKDPMSRNSIWLALAVLGVLSNTAYLIFLPLSGNLRVLAWIVVGLGFWGVFGWYIETHSQKD
jgi:hypothetical protein